MIRESLGLSAQWLADAVHVDQRTVRRWEDGEIPIRDDVIKLVRALDVVVDDWVTAIYGGIISDLGADYSHEEERANHELLLDGFNALDWPTAAIPRVDDDVAALNRSDGLLANIISGTLEDAFPAAFYRAAAARLSHRLKGMVHITYFNA